MTATRLDKWLFHARFYRTRPLAQAAAAAGRVRLNGARVDKPGHVLKPGDILTLGKGSALLAVRVLAVAERRGPAMQAGQLYEIVEEFRPVESNYQNCAPSKPLPAGATRRKHSPDFA
jgi:ribosome-associated heat shock protein Hsp15